MAISVVGNVTPLTRGPPAGEREQHPRSRMLEAAGWSEEAAPRPSGWSSLQPDHVGKSSELSLQLSTGACSEPAAAGAPERVSSLLTQTEN